jgi:hypothetical protein
LAAKTPGGQDAVDIAWSRPEHELVLFLCLAGAPNPKCQGLRQK